MIGNGIQRRGCLTWAAVAAAQLTTCWPAMAQEAGAFPNRPIRFLVPYPPGGGNDFFARVLSQKMSENLNQPVVIDNRPGAAGLIAGDTLAKAPPDGYTIMVDQSSIATNVLTYKKRQFDARKDIVPLMLGVTLDNAVLVGSQSPVRSLADLMELGKRPESIAYASTGIGSSQHLAMELLCNEAGIKLLHVPYKGTAAAITALVAGEVQVFIISVPTAGLHQGWPGARYCDHGLDPLCGDAGGADGQGVRFSEIRKRQLAGHLHDPGYARGGTDPAERRVGQGTVGCPRARGTDSPGMVGGGRPTERIEQDLRGRNSTL